jgi:hypothetical protein
VGYEEVGKLTLQDDHADAVIRFELPAESVEFRRQDLIKKIDRRVIDAGKRDSGVKPELEALVVGILHSSGSIAMTVRDDGSAREVFATTEFFGQENQ